MTNLRATVAANLPIPGRGETPLRHRRLFEIGRQNLSLARLAEAHWDALATLAEAGREPKLGAIYGVWASEKPGVPLRLAGNVISGTKMFSSGAGLIDRTLLTVQQLLVDVDLRQESITFDYSAWKTEAFRDTQTATAHFSNVPITEADIVGGEGFYLSRPGFWHGACGPAACWAGGAAGLLDWAQKQSRQDPHTLAHLGAMQANVWATQSYLECAGQEIDAHPNDKKAARIRARTVRHLIEQSSTDILRRLARAYGPHPLAMDEQISRRYAELDLYLRQSHAERDLESVGRDIRTNEDG